MKNISTQTRLGVIGYGQRARHMVQLMCEQGEDVRLVAIADPRGDALRERLSETHTNAQMPSFYDSADEMLGAESLDGVVIGTRCSLHAAMAVKVLSRGRRAVSRKTGRYHDGGFACSTRRVCRRPVAAHRGIVPATNVAGGATCQTDY